MSLAEEFGHAATRAPHPIHAAASNTVSAADTARNPHSEDPHVTVGVDGFILGKITDFEAQPCKVGDSFVVDGSRAGLAWEIGDSFRTYEILSFEPAHWGVWGVSFIYPMDSRENARRNLQMLVPFLKRQWEEWAKMRRQES